MYAGKAPRKASCSAASEYNTSLQNALPTVVRRGGEVAGLHCGWFIPEEAYSAKPGRSACRKAQPNSRIG
jgi:hypothetical protein